LQILLPLLPQSLPFIFAAAKVILTLAPLLLFALTPGRALLVGQTVAVVAAPVVITLIVIIALPITRLLGAQPFFFLATLLIAQLLVASLLIVALASYVSGSLVCLATLFFGLAALQLECALLVLLPLRIA
jgi:hypothetical protein